MATPVIMPRQGQSVESCIIGKLYKQKGEQVKVGDLLFSYETDKATFEEEAKTEGILLDFFYEEGDEVECLKVVCVIGNEGESADEFRDKPSESSPAVSAASAAYASGGAVADVGAAQESADAQADPGASFVKTLPAKTPAAASGFTPISPRAKALAEKTGADLSRAVPTGANNRIIEADVARVVSDGYFASNAVSGDFTGILGTGLGGRVTTFDMENIGAASAANFSAATSGIPNAPDSEEVKLSNVRKLIAKAMHTSLQSSAQLTHHCTFDATDVLGFRKNLKAVEEHPELSKITVTDIIIYAVSRILLKHKSMNAHFLGDKMTVFNNVHMGLAVDTPRGLLVPTIFNANIMTLLEISKVSKDKIEKSRQGTIAPDDLQGGTFTISNIGGFGIEMFTPVLNPPQTGILGVCSVVERTKNGLFYPAMGLSLTYDHRALDGADAARFQRELKEYLEKFSFNLALEGGAI